jgi:ABC-type glutathione transport system ATPase component
LQNETAGWQNGFPGCVACGYFWAIMTNLTTGPTLTIGPTTSYCLETTGLSHHFSARTPVLNNIDLRVPEGTIFGFLGPNGAGKTTTLRLV